MGRTLIIVGLVLVAAGLLLTSVKLGRLPGDLVVRGKHGVFYFPVVTCLVISLVLTLVMWLLGRR